MPEEPEAKVAHLGVPVGDVVAAETLALRVPADDALREVELGRALVVDVGVVAAEQVVGAGDHLEQHDLHLVLAHQPVRGHELIDVADHEVLALDDLLEAMGQKGLHHQWPGVFVGVLQHLFRGPGRPEARRRHPGLGGRR